MVRLGVSTAGTFAIGLAGAEVKQGKEVGELGCVSGRVSSNSDQTDLSRRRGTRSRSCRAHSQPRRRIVDELCSVAGSREPCCRGEPAGKDGFGVELTMTVLSTHGCRQMQQFSDSSSSSLHLLPCWPEIGRSGSTCPPSVGGLPSLVWSSAVVGGSSSGSRSGRAPRTGGATDTDEEEAREGDTR